MNNLEMRENVGEPIHIENEGARPTAPAYGSRGLETLRREGYM